MIRDGRVIGLPLVPYKDTKANVEALPLTAADAGAEAFATDTEERGVYSGSAWSWGKTVTNGDSHDHDGGDGAQINHTKLSNIGTNTHAQIDTHLASTANPHSVTAAQVRAVSAQLFGVGADGDVTISTNTTLTRDWYYNDLTVNSGVILNTNGYRIFVRGTLTLDGAIMNVGTAGSNGENGVLGVGGGAGGRAGGGAGSGSTKAALAGKDGRDAPAGSGSGVDEAWAAAQSASMKCT